VNRKKFGFGEGLFDQALVIFGEREECAGGCSGMKERNEGKACLGSCVTVLRQSIWRPHAHWD